MLHYLTCPYIAHQLDFLHALRYYAPLDQATLPMAEMIYTESESSMQDEGFSMWHVEGCAGENVVMGGWYISCVYVCVRGGCDVCWRGCWLEGGMYG